MAQQRKPVAPFVLLILDGWGIGPADGSNPLHLARLPHFRSYQKKYGYAELEASSVNVGLPADQDGNSEAGHMNLGAGRIVEQDSVMISRAISDGTFFKNPAFLQAVKHVKKHNSAVHLMGLLSNGQSAHSHPDHLIALVTYFRYQKISKIFLHLFTDGRDSHRFAAIKLLRKYQNVLTSHCTIATISGRAYAMDRKKDWRNTKKAYDAMVLGKALRENSSAEDAIIRAYNRGETDEFIEPTVITKAGVPVGKISNNDAVVFFNLRSDRARQLSKPFVQNNFERVNKGAFKRQRLLKKLFFVAMTDFGPDLDSILTAYPSRDITDTLPVALNKFRQVYIAESEKYAHITYFFNGGYDSPVAGEDRILIPSPDTLSYLQCPKMSLGPITRRVVSVIQRRLYDFIAVNVSNADMLAHTGDIPASVKAVEYVDQCLGKIVSATLAKGGAVCITADHGNVEELINQKSGEVDTEHSKSRVPFIFISPHGKRALRKRGILADVAPTILAYLRVQKPQLMTGKSLFLK